MAAFPTVLQLQQHLPHALKKFSDTPIVIDATEVRIQVPSQLKGQRDTLSSYKHYETLKIIVGTTPDSYIKFVSGLRGGSVSHRQIVQSSRLMSRLCQSDAIMVDKGFQLQDLLPPEVKVYQHPFRSGCQMSKEYVLLTRGIACGRMQIEKIIRRVKTFRILHKPFPLNMADIVEQMFSVSCFLCNFMRPLIK